MSKITNLIGTTWRLGDKPFTGVVGSYGDFSIIGDGSISMSAGEEGVTYTGVITEFKCGFGNNDDMVALGTEIDGLPTIIIGDTGDYIAVLTITITGGADISNLLFIDFINTYGTLVSGGEEKPIFTYDLTQLNLAAGTYSITIVAKAMGYNDAPSNTAQFIVEQESFVEETNEYGTTMVINKYTEEPNEYGTTMIIGGETTA